MVEEIKKTKDKVLRRLEQVIDEKGPERMNVQEVSMLADVVKDLAVAEKSCREAEYYMSVTDAMYDGSMGYDSSMGYDGMGYSDGSRNRQGYRGQPRDSMGRYRSGYRQERYGHDDMMQEVRQMIETAEPQERERLKMQLRQMTEM